MKFLYNKGMKEFINEHYLLIEWFYTIYKPQTSYKLQKQRLSGEQVAITL